MAAPTERKFGRTAASLEGKQPKPATVERENKVGLLEKMKRKLEDMRLGTEKLREQVKVAENALERDVPKTPGDVTLENVHQLKFENLTGKEDWKAAVEQLVTLPPLPKESEVSPEDKPAWRRARTEYGVASAVARLGDISAPYEMGGGQGKSLSVLLEKVTHPQGLPEDRQSEIRSQMDNLATQIQQRLELLAKSGSRAGWSPAEMEVIIDGIARSETELGDLDNPKDLTAEIILNKTLDAEARAARAITEKAEALAREEAVRVAAEQQAATEETDYRAALEVAGSAIAAENFGVFEPSFMMEILDKVSWPEQRQLMRGDQRSFFESFAENVEDSSDFPGKEESVRALRGLEKRWREAGTKYEALAERARTADAAGRTAVEQQIKALLDPLIADSKKVLEPGMRPTLDRVMPAVDGFMEKIQGNKPEAQASCLEDAMGEISQYMECVSGGRKIDYDTEGEFDSLLAAWGDNTSDDLELIKDELERRRKHLTEYRGPGLKG